MINVQLEGGPVDGQIVEVSDRRSPLLVTGKSVPEGVAARYRPTRRKSEHGLPILRFREYDRIVTTVPVDQIGKT